MGAPILPRGNPTRFRPSRAFRIALAGTAILFSGNVFMLDYWDPHNHGLTFPMPSCKHLLMLALTLSLVSPLAQGSFAAPTNPNTVHIQADNQTYTAASNNYQLKGRVRVQYQGMTITGEEATLNVDAAGQPSIARFTKSPKFIRTDAGKGQDVVTADVISVHLKDNVFGAEGNVHSEFVTVASDPFTIRADVQRFDNVNRLVTANGNVRVDHKGSKAASSEATVRLGEGGKAERVVFTGGASIEQADSQIHGGKITVLVDSGNLIAENNVKTVVKNSQDNILIYSDYQQYDKASDRVLASGHVKLIYGDYVANGPKATFKLKGYSLDKIVLTGRPTIKDKERNITADTITITVNQRHFDAAGNVKIQFQAKKNAAKPAPAAPAAGKKPPAKAGTPVTPATPAAPKDDPLDY